MTLDERKRIVRAGYDELSDRFGEWMARVEGDPWERFLDDLAARLGPGDRVLDLGSGNGAKIARLADRFDVTGVEISERQLRHARAAAPAASFVQADFTEVDLPAETFDAVTALYSIVHVPRDEQPALFARILGWLKPGGLFLASLSHVGGEDRVDEWLGVDMFFSGFDADTNRRLVREAGFELIEDQLVWMQEPESEVAFLWVLGVNRSETPAGDDRLLRARVLALDAYVGRDVGLPRQRARSVSAPARSHGDRDGGGRVPVRDSDRRRRRHVQPPALPDRRLPGDGRRPGRSWA